MSFTKTQNKFSKGIDDKADGTAVTIDVTGLVNIGDSTPATNLDVQQDSGACSFRIRGGSQQISLQTNGGVGTRWQCNKFNPLSWVTDSASFDWSVDGGATSAMRMDSLGNVGIGVDAPAQLLSVGDSDDVSINYIRINQRASAPDTTYGGLEFFYDNTAGITGVNAAIRYAAGSQRNDGELTFHTGVSGSTSERMRIDAKGSVHIGPASNDSQGYTIDLSPAGQQTAGIDINKTSPNVNLDLYAGGSPTNTGGWSGQIRFFTGGSSQLGTERMRINSSGNITTKGSGNAAPQLNVTNVGTGTSYLRFNDTATTASAGRYIGSAGDNMAFGNWGVAEHMRITDTGMLMVGRTSINSAATDHGIQMYPTGIVYQFTSASGNSDMHRWHNSDGTKVAAINGRGEGYFLGGATYSGPLKADEIIQDGAPVIDAKRLISTLSTLRNATKDETTLEGLRDSIGNAIGGLIEKFEAEIAAMPAPEIETGTMEIDA